MIIGLRLRPRLKDQKGKGSSSLYDYLNRVLPAIHKPSPSRLV